MRIEKKEQIFTLCRNGGDEGELEALLESDPNLDIDKADTNGYAPIHYVAKYNHSNLLAVLLRRDCAVNLKTKDSKRMTALHLLAEYNEHCEPVTENAKSVAELMQTNEILASLGAEKSRIDKLRFLEKNNYQCRLASMEQLLQQPDIDVNQMDHMNRTPLHIAAIHNNYLFTRDLCFLKRDCLQQNELDKYNKTAIFYAGLNENADMVRLLSTFSYRPEHTIFHDLCKSGNLEVMCSYMQTGWEEYFLEDTIEKVDERGMLGIQYAVQNGHWSLMRFLLEFLAKRDRDYSEQLLRQTEQGNSLVHLATLNGKAQMIEYLLDGPLSGQQDSVDRRGQTALHLAAEMNSFECCQVLMKHGYDLEAKDYEGKTPLLTAAANNSFEAFECLHRSRVQVDAIDITGKSCILLAIEAKSTKILEYFMQNENIRKYVSLFADHNGDSVLHYIAKINSKPMAELILADEDLRTFINMGNEDGVTPLHVAAANNSIDVIAYIFSLDESYQENSIDEDGDSVMHYVCAAGHSSMVSLLLEHNFGFEQLNALRETAFDVACKKGHLAVLQLLVRAGANVGHHAARKRPPLLHAALNGQAEVCRFLLDAGADIVVRTDKNTEAQDAPPNSNALEIAIEKNYPAVVKVLLSNENWFRLMRKRQSRQFNYDTPMRKLIRNMPKMAVLALDNCKLTDDDGTTYWYEFIEDTFAQFHGDHRTHDEGSFYNKSKEFLKGQHCLVVDQAEEEQDMLDKDLLDTPYTNSAAFVMEQHPLNLMMEMDREELLKHEVTKRLLKFKWSKPGAWIYYFTLFIYIAFLACYTAYVLGTTVPYTYTYDQEKKERLGFDDACTLIQLKGVKAYILPDWAMSLLRVLVIMTAIINLLSEFVQIHVYRLEYFKEFDNWMQLTIYSLSFITVADVSGCAYETGLKTDWQWQCTAFCLLLTWLNMVAFLKVMPYLGIYIIMLGSVTRTFIKFIAVFFVLIIAFGLAFYILVRNQIPFNTVSSALFNTGVMLLGEINYGDRFEAHSSGRNFENSIFHPPFTYVIFIFFIILMNVILINLLVGLAVEDISKVKREASLTEIKLKVAMTLRYASMLPFAKQRKYCKIKSLKPAKKFVDNHQHPGITMSSYREFFSSALIRAVDDIYVRILGGESQLNQTADDIFVEDQEEPSSAAFLNQIRKKLDKLKSAQLKSQKALLASR
ncbi:hypothetical protein Ciccas_008013 [Cichlidogyrus casuarinus]|uniref:Ion transport domain-containing protein n=1 Tax=Cichlidogyrus casuarinus TaxID=1844966 RepID=A0ABD2Q174_9PLAT